MDAAAYVITTTPQQVLGPGHYGAALQADSANTVDVYVGGLSVTADATSTGGYRLAAGATLPIEVRGNDPVWAVCASGAPVLRVLRTKPASDSEIGAS